MGECRKLAPPSGPLRTGGGGLASVSIGKDRGGGAVGC